MGRRVLQVGAGALLGLVSALVILRPGAVTDPADEDPHVLPSPLPAGELGLRAHTGDTVRTDDLPHRFTVVFFGYTACPDVCPVTMANLARAREALGPAGREIGGILVSVDPTRDTPERLDAFLASFDSSFLGLTGTPDEIRHVAETWGVYVDVPEGADPEAGYLVDHTARAFVVDRGGSVVATFPPGTGADAMAATLGRLLDRG